MGGIGSKLTKPLKNWNIENRAQKVISRDKPKPAPTYNSTKKQIELVNKLEPDYKVKAQRKDQQLDEYLKKVFVTSNSTEVQEIDQRSNPDRPLPKDRLLPEGFKLGHYEPSVTRPGRISLSQAVELLSNHKKEPEKYTAEYLAAEYKLEKEVVENILSHFSLFTVYNTVKDHNQDIIASTIPISQTTGVGVHFTENDEDPSEDEKLRKMFRQTPPSSALPVEEEKKKSLT